MFKNKAFKFICLLLAFTVILLSAVACGKDTVDKNDGQAKTTLTATVSKDPKFDSAVLSLTADDFTNAGFSFGDSFNVEFDNGCTLTDVPYYNGYYVKTGDPVIVAYPKNDYVLIAKNNRDFWTPENLIDGCTVKITLNTAKKYIATFEALGQSYSTERSTYDSDEAFANFRALSGGNMKDNFIYRGASPVDNSRSRAAITDSILKKTGIVCIIDLADSQIDMNEYFEAENFNSEYSKALYEKGNTVLLSMSANYDSEAYKASVAQGMRHLLQYGGPAYIHCMEGKDRTGFVCMLLEALVGADYDEMCADYMKTYENYYGITKTGTPERYDAVVSLYFDSFAEYLLGTSDADALKSADYTQAAKSYLLDCGMSESEIQQLITLLSK